MEITKLKLEDIKPYNNNPRKKIDIEKVAKSIKEFGWQQPIVVDKNNVIIVGHSRFEAAKMLKEKTAPVVITDMSEKKAKGYRIADNKTNQYSEWDYELLHNELQELIGFKYDLDNLGFNSNELDTILNWENTDNKWLDAKEEWKEMPEFEHDDLAPYRRLIVNFGNKDAVEKFFKLIGQDFTDKTKFINIPFRPKQVLKDKGYGTE
jgi:ParB-like chromosome segregation protein Spo0J